MNSTISIEHINFWQIFILTPQIVVIVAKPLSLNQYVHLFLGKKAILIHLLKYCLYCLYLEKTKKDNSAKWDRLNLSNTAKYVGNLSKA